CDCDGNCQFIQNSLYSLVGKASNESILRIRKLAKT
ncbi:MAG: hypothetical protein ACI8RD_013283, partial [Bacillariaceae sp.]